MEKIDLRNVVVNYQYRSAHQVLWDMCLKLGIENVRAALDEIDAEQSVHQTGLTAAQKEAFEETVKAYQNGDLKESPRW